MTRSQVPVVGRPAPGSRRRAAVLVVLLLTALAAAWWFGLGRPVRFGALASATVLPDSDSSSWYRLESLTLMATSGRRVSCALRTPRAVPPSAPAVVLSGGIGTGRRAALLVDPTYPGIVVSCDYPWHDPTRHPVRDLLLLLPATRARVLASPQALALAGAYLVGRADVPPGHIAAVGASLGVPVVSAWAAADPVPHAVALVYGGGDLRLILERNLRRHIGVGWLRHAVARVGAWGLGPLDPVRTVGRIAPRSLLVIGAPDDQRIPREAVEALYASAGEPKQLFWFTGRHMHPTDQALLQALADTTVRWLTAVLP